MDFENGAFMLLGFCVGYLLCQLECILLCAWSDDEVSQSDIDYVKEEYK